MYATGVAARALLPEFSVVAVAVAETCATTHEPFFPFSFPDDNAVHLIVCTEAFGPETHKMEIEIERLVAYGATATRAGRTTSGPPGATHARRSQRVRPPR